MTWYSQSCTTENSSVFKQGTVHGKMPNATCDAFFCNSYNRLEWYCYFVIVLWFLALLIGFLGNTLTLLYYTYTTKSWTTSTVFLFNLALCDFTWVLLIPFSVYYHLHKQQIYFNLIFCQFKKIFFDINIYGSIYFLTLISFDRYIGAVHPIRSLKWWDKNKAVFCTIAIWIFIFIESIPDFCYLLVVHKQRDAATKLENAGEPVYFGEPLYFVVPFTISRVLFGFLIPVIIIFICYALTLRSLWQMKRCQQRRPRNVKPLMLVSAAMIVFAVAFIPYHVMMMAVLIYRLNYQLNSDNISLIVTVYEFTEIICGISSCLDPVIFMFASKKFQQKFKTIKCPSKHRCHCCQSHRIRDIAQL
ncbi:P2Y purinoceptor 1-like [Sphaerodactylus townsendi]|uniref:P2Y purinoceptor 1-like n=1 Tax=Sphaerodactylus townsendi TaxID=933632 RepID=UPI002026DEE8|nr:P2Y purinoceptor 1-like [Sphaerodactylus townsendi]